MIEVNVKYFTETADYYNKHSRYPDGIYDSYEYHEFWDEELYRCLYGYSVGGLNITGYHYFYLNHWPIWLVKKKGNKDLYGEVTKNRSTGDRDFTFPAFWDVDLNFFNELEAAINDGQHLLVLKPRGTGFSNKGAAIAGRNFFCIPGSKNYLIADNKEFLLGDGLFNKWLDGRRFLTRLHPDLEKSDKIFHNPLGKHSDFKKDKTGMHYKASSDIDGVEEGYMSEVMGIAMDADTDKVRGKRGKIIELEEIGAMRKAETAFNVLKSSVEQGRTVFGTIIGYGTGGTVATIFGDMEKMFFNPKAYNIRAVPNMWDEGMSNTFISFFTPAYRNIDFVDKNGNSLEESAKKFYDEERKIAEKSTDQNAIIQQKAEHPYTPTEAILRTTSSVLPSAEAANWHNKMVSLGLHKIGVPGKLIPIDKGILFTPDYTLKPIDTFPHNMQDNLTGCVVQYYAPFKIDGQIPDDLYIIALDPYAFDQSSDGKSIGAAYVYIQPNNIPGAAPGDRLVATYFARPEKTDDFNEVLFNLARYYNAKIGFENDRGDTIGYAKRFKLLDWLAEEFELAFDADLPKSKVKRQFGMHIGSGKENLRMHKGNMYLKDWLITARSEDESGNRILNLHTIYCPSTLKEIQAYRNDGGNFDRISALRILAYHQKELVYKDKKPDTKRYARKVSDNFWNRKHFQNA